MGTVLFDTFSRVLLSKRTVPDDTTDENIDGLLMERYRGAMKMKSLPEIKIELQDSEWPLTYTDHDRRIARAIVVDDAGNYYFVRAVRDDDFGAATLIEL